jgi:hypothetical protein
MRYRLMEILTLLEQFEQEVRQNNRDGDPRSARCQYAGSMYHLERESLLPVNRVAAFVAVADPPTQSAG